MFTIMILQQQSGEIVAMVSMLTMISDLICSGDLCFSNCSMFVCNLFVYISPDSSAIQFIEELFDMLVSMRTWEEPLAEGMTLNLLHILSSSSIGVDCLGRGIRYWCHEF